MMKYLMPAISLAFILCSCTTTVQSNPTRTATEEMLISSAADRAASKLALQIPPDANVFVDSTNFEGTDSKYAIASIRSDLLLRSIHLIDDRKKADVIVETRAGALSTDRKTFLIGIPQFNIPIPLASGSLPFPEIALYGSEDQKGVAKFALTGYYAKGGTLAAAQDPQYGFSHNTKKTLLIFISWTDSDYLPQNAEKEAQANKTGQKKKPHLGINGNGYAPAVGTSSSTPSPAPTAASAPPSAPATVTSMVR